jgi:tetratricopeptide (TPR) repeat protein
LGRDDVRSSELNRRAAEMAAESLAFDAAAAMLDRALESQRRIEPRDLALELRSMVELGRVLDEVGDLKRAESVLEDAVLRAHSSETRDRELAAALLGLARVRSDRIDLKSAQSLASEAFEILHRLHDARGVMAAHRVLGATSYRLGKLDEAEHHQRAELKLAEEHGTPSEQGHALIDLANTFISRGPARIQEALGLYDRAAAIFADRDDPAAQARVRMNRGLLYHNSGRMDEALADLIEAAEAAERSRSKVWIGYTQLNLAQVRAELHDPAAARRALDRALALLEPMGDRLITQSSKMILGIIAEEEGDLPAAEAQYGEAVQLARDLGLGPDASESLFRLGQVLARSGDRTEAAARLREAFGLGLLEQRADLLAPAVELAKELGVEVPAAHR